MIGCLNNIRRTKQISLKMMFDCSKDLNLDNKFNWLINYGFIWALNFLNLRNIWNIDHENELYQFVSQSFDVTVFRLNGLLQVFVKFQQLAVHFCHLEPI